VDECAPLPTGALNMDRGDSGAVGGLPDGEDGGEFADPWVGHQTMLVTSLLSKQRWPDFESTRVLRLRCHSPPHSNQTLCRVLRRDSAARRSTR